MRTSKIVAMLAAVLLSAGEFLLLDHDARQRVVAYRAEVVSVAPQGE